MAIFAVSKRYLAYSPQCKLVLLYFGTTIPCVFVVVMCIFVLIFFLKCPWGSVRYTSDRIVWGGQGLGQGIHLLETDV